MPRISVKERDLSWYYNQRDPGQLTVLIPGVATWGPYEPTLVNKDNFSATYGNKIVDSSDLSFIQAASFVEVGINVLFWRQPLPGDAKAYYEFPNLLKINAKYAGSFGNDLKIKIVTLDNKVMTFYVYKTEGNQNVLLEQLVYNFTDINSVNYYEEVNRTSAYIEVNLLGKIDGSDLLIPNDYLSLADGADGTFDSDAIAIGLATNEYCEELKDKLMYDFDIIVNGCFGLTQVSGEENTVNTSELTKVDQLFLDIAGLRGDTIYLIDANKGLSAEELFDYCGLINRSYAAAFGPWCASTLLYNGSVRILPGSYAFLIAWGNSLSEGTPIWMAPAGVKRASLGGVVKDTVYPVGSAILEKWQNQETLVSTNGAYKVNPITKLKQYGYVVYGNSTLLKTSFDGKTSMLNQLSCRILSNLIKRRAFDISLTLQFDQLDSEIFAEFKTLLTVFMDQLRYGRALYDYAIEADYSLLTFDDLNSRRVPVLIRISPNPAAENFDITLEITPAGVSFSGDDVDNSSLENV